MALLQFVILTTRVYLLKIYCTLFKYSHMPDQLLWKKVLSELELEVSPAVFNTMFKQTLLAGVSDGVATVACMSTMIQRLIETRYYTLVKRAVDRNIGRNTSIIFTVDARIKRVNGQKQAAPDDIGPLFQTVNGASSLAKRYGLGSDYTFENFAVSPTNQLAFAAASHVSKKTGDTYNPLFLYGGVGVGKTHLMQAVGHTILQKDSTTRVVYCAGEEFTNEIVEAIRTKTTPAFRNKFRRAELLCIDDIQFIAGKETVQEEFFHTFNAVLKEGGQIILTSDKAPYEIAKLEPRIKSRLEGGLLVDIAPPDFELRVAIFLIKAKNRGLDFPTSLAQPIATTITDTRGLEGFLTRITSEMEIKNSPLSEDLILKLLGKKPNGQQSTSAQYTYPTKDAFIDAICSYFQVKATQIKGKKRDQNLVLPRQMLMYLLRTELNISLSEIGGVIGGRDHTTVIYAVGKISSLISTSEKLRGDILGIKRLVYG